MEKSLITEEIRLKLREPFPDEAYSAHPTKTFLTTLKAMYVTERLNDVFGIGRWDIKHEVVERTDDYVLIIGEFISLDYSVTVPKQYGGHKTNGRNTEIADGYKSAVTDCQSKIASYLEIGIDMFKGKISPKGGKAPKQTPNNDLPWLNKGSKDWDGVLDAIRQKLLTDVSQIKKFKLSKTTKEELQKLIKDA